MLHYWGMKLYLMHICNKTEWTNKKFCPFLCNYKISEHSEQSKHYYHKLHDFCFFSIGQQCLAVVLGQTLTHGEQCVGPAWHIVTELLSYCAPAGPWAHCLDSPSDVVFCRSIDLAVWPKCYYCRLREQRRGNKTTGNWCHGHSHPPRSDSNPPSPSSLRPHCRIKTEMNTTTLGVYNLMPPYSLSCLCGSRTVLCIVQSFGLARHKRHLCGRSN